MKVEDGNVQVLHAVSDAAVDVSTQSNEWHLMVCECET